MQVTERVGKNECGVGPPLRKPSGPAEVESDAPDSYLRNSDFLVGPDIIPSDVGSMRLLGVRKF